MTTLRLAPVAPMKPLATLPAMRFERTPLAGSWVIELDRNDDERGTFARTFCADEFADHDLPVDFPQSNLSTNTHAGTLRGLHFCAAPSAESKLVRCVRGAAYDVVIDLRPASTTRLQWFGVELTAANGRALFVPADFAHGFVTLVAGTDVYYHMGDVYRPGTGRGIRWDDPTLGIEWPRPATVISDRDAGYPDLDAGSFDPTSWPW